MQDLFNLTDEGDPEYMPDSSDEDRDSETGDVLDSPCGKDMGHDIRIHREVYRMPSGTMQLAKISKLLIALDKGTLPQNSSLEDIEIGEEDEVVSDSDSGQKYFVNKMP